MSEQEYQKNETIHTRGAREKFGKAVIGETEREKEKVRMGK